MNADDEHLHNEDAKSRLQKSCDHWSPWREHEECEFSSDMSVKTTRRDDYKYILTHPLKRPSVQEAPLGDLRRRENECVSSNMYHRRGNDPMSEYDRRNYEVLMFFLIGVVEMDLPEEGENGGGE